MNTCCRRLATTKVDAERCEKLLRDADETDVRNRGGDQAAEQANHLLSEDCTAVAVLVVAELYRVEIAVITLEQLWPGRSSEPTVMPLGDDVCPGSRARASNQTRPVRLC